jgi:hypothetical protein
MTQNLLHTPWKLYFDRDGTEDFGIICDAEGKDIAASHLPSTRIGERTFETGTFWLPEEDHEELPVLVRQLRIMTAAPRLLAALITCADLLADYDDSDGEEGAAYREALAAITEAVPETV